MFSPCELLEASSQYVVPRAPKARFSVNQVEALTTLIIFYLFIL